MSLQLPKVKNPFGYDQLRSFQVGGQVEDTTDKQDPTKLLYVLYNFVMSGKAPKSGDPDDIMALLQENESETMAYEAEYDSKTPEELQEDTNFMKFYAQFQPEQDQAAYLAKGAKIKQLKVVAQKYGGKALPPKKAIVAKPVKKDTKPTKEANQNVTDAISNPVLTKGKKGMLVKKGGKKKCSCGCDLILSKAAGGKVIETCSCKCGGKMKKKK